MSGNPEHGPVHAACARSQPPQDDPRLDEGHRRKGAVLGIQGLPSRSGGLLPDVHGPVPSSQGGALRLPLDPIRAREVKDLLPDLLGDHRRAKALADSLASALRAKDMQRFGQAALQLYEHMDEHIGEEDREIWPAMKIAVPAKLSEAAFIDANHNFDLQMGADFTARMERFATELKSMVEGG